MLVERSIQKMLSNLYDPTSAVKPVDGRDRRSNRLAVKHDIRAACRRHHFTVTWCLVEEQVTWLVRLLRGWRRLDYCNGRQATGHQSQQTAASAPATPRTSRHLSHTSTRAHRKISS